MNFRAAKLLHRHRLAEDFLDDGRSGDEHLARVLHLEYEVGERGRIGADADTGPHDR